MKTKQFLFAALAAIALAGCTSDDILIADTPPADNNDGMMPIMFSSLKNNFTRAGNDIGGANAAELLGKKFVVFGYKGDETKTLSKKVFDNYAVEYRENTAGTTESNSHNWEYVGVAPITHATNNGITQQTIKYWDYAEKQYDFIAWSAGKKTAIYSGTPEDGQVLVSAIEAKTASSPASGLEKGYTIYGSAADLKECYISDIVTVLNNNNAKDAGVNTVKNYNQPVTLRFRQLGTKVRIGIYETIPGYSVRDVEFYTEADKALPTTDADKATLFTTTENDIKTKGTYTISFPTTDDASKDDNNQAHVSFTGDGSQTTTVGFGKLAYTIAEDGETTKGNVFLGRTSNTASMAVANDGNDYFTFLPNANGTNLNLRVNYILESIDGSGEVIEVKGATAQVPSIYAEWKPGYAYTYLFKISDKTNGVTGVYDPTNPNGYTTESNPAGLYPITFDAVVVNAEEDKTQETITTVSAPSITTYQQKSKVVNKNEYAITDGDIYVTVNDAPSATPDLPNGVLQELKADNAKMYLLSEAKTEAYVVDALRLQDDDAVPSGASIKGRNGLVLTEETLSFTNEVEFGADGNVITIPADGEKKKAAKFVISSLSAGTYAFVYTKTASTSSTDEYQAKSFTTGVSVKGYYRYAYDDTPTGDVKENVLYFTNATSGKKDVFLGQTVNNLYVKDGSNYVAASGYAKTGVTYYYVVNPESGVRQYKAAHPVTYSSAPLSGLYEVDTTNPLSYKETTDSGNPTAGKAYYYRDGDNYVYCVFLPEQADSLLILDTNTKESCGDSETAVNGMTYFDKYTSNNGVYYAKVIKLM